jgi:predicted  nucleic acid-binding Zn-ribbon protein
VTVNVDTLANEIRVALDAAHARIDKLREERLALNVELKNILAEIKRLERLQRAVTPRSQNGPDDD